MKILSITKTLLVAGLLAAPLCHAAPQDEEASGFSPVRQLSPVADTSVTVETEQDGTSTQAAALSSLSDNAAPAKKEKKAKSKKSKKAEEISSFDQPTSSVLEEEASSYGYSYSGGNDEFSAYGLSPYSWCNDEQSSDLTSSVVGLDTASDGKKKSKSKRRDELRAASATQENFLEEIKDEQVVRQGSHDNASQVSGTSSSRKVPTPQASAVVEEKEEPKTVTLPQLAVVNAAEGVRMTIGQQDGKLVFGIEPPVHGLVPNAATGAIEAALHADFFKGNRVSGHILSSRENVDIGFKTWTQPQCFNGEEITLDTPVTGLFKLFSLSEEGDEIVLAHAKRTFKLGDKNTVLQVILSAENNGDGDLQTKVRLDWAEPSAEDDNAEEDAHGGQADEEEAAW